MIYLLLATLITLVVLILVVTPFFVGPGGRLAPAESINDQATLESIQRNIVRRFITEEKAFSDKHMTEGAWRRRREFLESKYIDVSRRLDYLTKLEEIQKRAE